MSNLDLIRSIQKINELSAEIYQRLESAIKETNCLNPRYEKLSTALENLASMKSCINDLQDNLMKKHETISMVKHDLCVWFLTIIGTFIGAFGTLYFLR
jgi:uncharacterized protein YeaC (DUF1315 family)